MTKYYVKIKGIATLIAKLSNNKTEKVNTLVTGYGYLHSCPAQIEGMMDDEWFDLEDKTVEVCYPDEFLVKVGDNVWVEQDDGTTIEKILEVIEIQDDIGIIEYEKD
jgi:hypothetical protein